MSLRASLASVAISNFKEIASRKLTMTFDFVFNFTLYPLSNADFVSKTQMSAAKPVVRTPDRIQVDPIP